MRPMTLLIILLGLLALRLACDGFYYATGQDFPWQGWLTLALGLAPIVRTRQDAAEIGEPVRGLWKTFMVTFALVLIVLAGVVWLIQHARLDLGLSSTRIERATRVVCDVGYAAASGILLVGWWRERHVPPGPPARAAVTQAPP